MKIDTIEVSKKFKYLWLKKVSGYDLAVHCAKSLVGEYSDLVGKDTVLSEGIGLEDGVWYLCGVSEPYSWKDNFHFAFMTMPGCEAKANRHGVRILVSDAIELPISASYIDKSLPQAAKSEYKTCRNWQFANFLKSSGLL